MMMAVQRTRWGLPSWSTEVCLPVVFNRDRIRPTRTQFHFKIDDRRTLLRVSAVDRGSNSGGDTSSNINSGSDSAPQNTTRNGNKNTRKGSPTPPPPSPSPSSSPSSSSNYVVPLDKSSAITRPLAEILRDLNKRIPDNIIKSAPHEDDHYPTFIPWYHANRMLSFYAPGWCGEIRDVIFSENASVTVVYRVTIRGSDGEAHRESTGTVSSSSGQVVDPVAAAEEIAFCRACARFGLGLYLYHDS